MELSNGFEWIGREGGEDFDGVRVIFDSISNGGPQFIIPFQIQLLDIQYFVWKTRLL